MTTKALVLAVLPVKARLPGDRVSPSCWIFVVPASWQVELRPLASWSVTRSPCSRTALAFIELSEQMFACLGCL